MKKKTKIKITSLEAFADLVPRLGNMENQMLRCIKQIQPCSDKMISQRLGWKINQVNGRRNALVGYGVVINYKKDIDQVAPFKRVIYWKIKDFLDQVIV